MALQTREARVVDIGPAQFDPTFDCFLVRVLVLNESDGTMIRLREVVVPGAVYPLLKIGTVGRFELLHLRYPKPFGSYVRAFVYKLSCDNSNVDGGREVHAWIRISKGAALHYLWFGLILIPAFGLGLLLWICAARLILVNVRSLSISEPRKGESQCTS